MDTSDDAVAVDWIDKRERETSSCREVGRMSTKVGKRDSRISGGFARAKFMTDQLRVAHSGSFGYSPPCDKRTSLKVGTRLVRGERCNSRQTKGVRQLAEA
jgi:hypothetical protein